MIGGAAAPAVLPVDLGLPSGTLWADRNLGAMGKSDFGLYFSWGNLEGRRFEDGYSYSAVNYASTPGAAISGDLTVANDAAARYLGESWRTPSNELIAELRVNTTHAVMTIDGVKGLRLTSTLNGNWIFVPFAGIWDETQVRYIGTASWSIGCNYKSDTEFWAIQCIASGMFRSSADKYKGWTVRACIPGTI